MKRGVKTSGGMRIGGRPIPSLATNKITIQLRRWQMSDDGAWWLVAAGRMKRCSNLATAEAWSKVIIRAARKQGWSETRILNMNMSLVHDSLMGGE